MINLGVGIIAGCVLWLGLFLTLRARSAAAKIQHTRGQLLDFMGALAVESGYNIGEAWLSSRYHDFVNGASVNPSDLNYFGPRFDLRILVITDTKIETRERKLQKLERAVKTYQTGANLSYSSDAIGDSCIVTFINPLTQQYYQIDSPEPQDKVVAGEAVMGLFVANSLVAFTSHATDKKYYANFL